MGGGGGGSKPKKETPPPQAQPIDYGAMMAQSSAAASKQYRDQLKTQIESYPKMEKLQLGTISKISNNLDNRYTRDADTALGAAASEAIKLTRSGDRIGGIATRGNQLARDAEDFADGPTALDRQIARLGASAMSQQADQVKGQKVAKTGNMKAAKVQPVRNVKADKVQAATAKGAQVANVKDVQAATGKASQMRNVKNVQAAQAGRVSDVRAQRARAAQGAAAQMGQVADVGTRDIRANAAERALMNEARGGGLLGQLESQASNDLALGRSLSAEQERDAIQSARAGAAARGMATGNSAMAAELLNRDRYATQREAERRDFASGVLNQGTGIRQVANQASLTRQEGNAVRNLQADLANQSTDFNTGQFNASTQQAMALANMQNRQQASLSNQDAFLRAGLANQSTGLQLGTTNAQLRQQAALQNQQTDFNTGQFNAGTQQQMALANMANRQQANLTNFDFDTNRATANAQMRQQSQQFNAANQQQARLANQQTGLSASLANQQTGLQIGLTNAGFRQAANAANFDVANNRAFTEAGYRQQASLANQDANQRQVELNRAFLQNANQSGINSEISRGGYAMGALGQTANLIGQQAGAYQNAAGLGINIANQSMANDPYMRAFAPGTSIGGSTLGTSANMIGNTYNTATQMAGNVASFNANMLDSRYNSYMNNQAALQGAGIQAGASRDAGMMSMFGQLGGGGMAAAGSIGGAMIVGGAI